MVTRLLPLTLALAVAPPAAAQAPPAEWDRAAVGALKEVHDRGRELYNGGDPVGAFRLYEGALLAVGPLLAHRPAAREEVRAGLDEARSAESPRVGAFRLHTALENVRAELKKPLPRPAEAAKEPPPVRKTPPVPAAGPGVSGTVTLDGKPLGRVKVSFSRPGVVPPNGTTREDGTYAITQDVAAGEYTMLFESDAGGPVPVKYKYPATSGVTVKVVEGKKDYDFDLKSK